MVAFYFAYGSNMNPQRMLERRMQFSHAQGARLAGFRLEFDKSSKTHPEIGHANIVYDPDSAVEGVLYSLVDSREIGRMDKFENAPINYSRDVVELANRVHCWTYFANPGVRQAGLRPSRSYLNHLLAGKAFLSDSYYQMLSRWECLEDR